MEVIENLIITGQDLLNALQTSMREDLPEVDLFRAALADARQAYPEIVSINNRETP